MNLLKTIVLPHVQYWIVFLLFLLFFAVTVARLARLPDPPLAYSADEYVPESHVVAPGGTLVFTPSIMIQRAGRIAVLRTYWNRDTHGTATLCDGTLAPNIELLRNLPRDLAGVLFEANAQRIVIPDLPPGRYWLITSASKADGGEDVYQIAFVVEQKCKE